MKKYKIYALQKDEFIYYIGITIRPLKERRKDGWKWSADNKFLKTCYMYVLEETFDKQREYFYIQSFSQLGHPLVNKVDGSKCNEDNQKEYGKTYYKHNKEKCLNNMKKYQMEHKEEQQQYRKEYYKKYNKDNAEYLKQRKKELYQIKKEAEKI
jgi:hypothetical protein